MITNVLTGAGKGIDFQVIGHHAYSLADQFEALTRAVAWADLGDVVFPIRSKGMLGPDAPPPAPVQARQVPWKAFREATLDVLSFIESEGRVPSRVFIGPDPIAPADFLVALASAYNIYQGKGDFPAEEGVAIGVNPEVLPARHIAADTPELFGDWIIHKEGFRAPKILEEARLQAWTLKPALPKATSSETK
jgi:hypothetical protein